jgi:hypothetical protein
MKSISVDTEIAATVLTVWSAVRACGLRPVEPVHHLRRR